MNQNQNQVYKVPDALVGKTIGDIVNQYGGTGSAYASLLGVGEKQAFTPGQTFSVNVADQGSGEVQNLSKIFGPGVSQAQNAQTQRVAAVQPAIDTYQSSKDPLKARYSKVIQDILDQRGAAENSQDIATAQEFGKRGIPLSSGVYANAINTGRKNIDVQYAGIEDTAAGEEADRSSAIDQAIANLQASAGNLGISDAQSLQQAQEQVREFNVGQSNAQQQLDLAKQQASKPAQTTYNQVQKGDYIYTYDSNGKLTNTQYAPPSKSTTNPVIDPNKYSTGTGNQFVTINGVQYPVVP